MRAADSIAGTLIAFVSVFASQDLRRHALIALITIHDIINRVHLDIRADVAVDPQ